MPNVRLPRTWAPPSSVTNCPRAHGFPFDSRISLTRHNKKKLLWLNQYVDPLLLYRLRPDVCHHHKTQELWLYQVGASYNKIGYAQRSQNSPVSKLNEKISIFYAPSLHIFFMEWGASSSSFWSQSLFFLLCFSFIVANKISYTSC